VGGPVGSGKTALVERLCKTMRDAYDIAVVTNDIYTKEDAEFLTRAGALAPDRIVGVETAAARIRRSARTPRSISRRCPTSCASGPTSRSCSWSPAATILQRPSPRAGRSHDLCHRCRSRGENPAQGRAGITRSDLLIINKIDLAPLVGANLEVMDRDARRMRGQRPFLFSNLKENKGVDEVAAFIVRQGGLPAR
jgi:urease accessory protein